MRSPTVSNCTVPQPSSPEFDPRVWIARATGNLRLAALCDSAGILYEDLCFQRQQAAEKALKAVHVHKNIPYRYTHNIDELVVNLRKGGIVLPDPSIFVADLTRYATETRYPGPYEPLSESDYREAFAAAEFIVQWARKEIDR